MVSILPIGTTIFVSAVMYLSFRHMARVDEEFWTAHHPKSTQIILAISFGFVAGTGIVRFEGIFQSFVALSIFSYIGVLFVGGGVLGGIYIATLLLIKF